ncbi:DUF4097 domain-containing protein [uncultured Jatrophihabitans sp.]|uniref:DUF4097 family beta strand repeat-containing protein n=1 Tax=uncultured Jatrophihabitans sp. TaxID=1610747 RepID=UPI0035CB34E6
MTTHTFPLTGPINVHARIGAGSLRIETADGLSAATVELDGAAEVLAATIVELRGPTLTVLGPRQGGVFDLPFLGARRTEHAGLAVRIVVPTGTAVRAATFTAPITVIGTVGGADLAFGHGSATVEHVTGDLRLRFGGGSAAVEQVDGAVETRSGAGGVRLGEVGGDIVAACGSGDLTVEAVRGDVRARSGSGGAAFGAVHGDVDLASGAGRLEIGLPAGVSASLNVHTGLGAVHSELPIEDAPTAANRTISIRARTGNGDVRLYRAA